MRRIASLTFVILACALSVAGQTVNRINTVAGGGAEPSVATSAYLPQPYAAVRDTAGNTYISVPTFSVVFKVTTGGTLSVYAGNGVAGFSGDGGAATAAQLAAPEGLAIDANGNLFIADMFNERIRRVDGTTHIITTVAGSEDPFNGKFDGDKGPATNARLNGPHGVAVDATGNLFIADTNNGAIREVAAATGDISTIAGGGPAAGCSPSNGAGFANPTGIAVDANGNVFVSDQNLQIVCKITPSLAISTYAGTLGTSAIPGQPNGDGGAATSATLLLPAGLTTDGSGNLYIADAGDPKIRKVTASTGVISTVAGIGLICTNAQEPACGDGTAATAAEFNFPQGVFFDSVGNIVVADTNNQRVRVISTAGTITALAGGGTGGDGAAGTSGILGLSQYVVVDSGENVYALESNGERLRELNATTQNLSTVAGDGYGGATIDCTGTTCGAANNGDGGPATQARFVFPDGVATDSSGNFYILDASTEVVRVVNRQTTAITVAGVSIPAGDIATIAGNGVRCGKAGNPNATPGCGDGGAAKSASLLNPFAVAVDSTGNVYIGDAGLSTVRIVNTAGTISTFAGTPGQACTTYPTNCGVTGSPTSALLSFPIGLATFNLAGINVVYIADAGDNVIRLVNPETNQISTYAFNGLPTFGGDGGPALNASMQGPSQLAIDNRGNLYVGGGSDNVVRRIEAGSPPGTAGTVITVAGDVNNLDGGFSGDGGPSTSALLGNYGLAIFNTTNQTDDLFIADSGSNRIRRVNLAPVTVESGSFTQFGPALAGSSNTSSQLIAFTNNGLDDLLLSVKVTGSSAFVLPASNGPGGTYIFQVSPGSTGELIVNFNPPAGVSGMLTATMTITTNDTANPIPPFSLAGTVTAPATLNVTISPTGPTVPGNVFGSDSTSNSTIFCPTSGCTGTFPTGSTVELVASPNPGFAFQSWNVGNAPDAASCASDTTGFCTFTITQSESIGANFTTSVVGPTNYTLTVVGYGNGSGTVTSTPSGISCTITNGAAGGTGCSATFSQAAAPNGVTLTPTASTPPAGSVFVGWHDSDLCTSITNGACLLPAFPTAIGAVFSGPAQPFASGQVFLSTDDGLVFVLNPTNGSVVQVLNGKLPGSFGQGGMTFDSVGNLYFADSTSPIEVFNSKGGGPTLFGNGGCPPCDNSPNSVVVDPFGNVLVGENFITGDEEPTLLQFAPGTGATGTASATYYPAYDTLNTSAFWVEVLDSSDTIAYTLGGNTVKVFDLGEQLQHPDIVPNPALTTGEALYALREVPDKSLLAAASDRIIHMDQSGNILHSYQPGTTGIFRNLNLDPDGVSFWTNDELTGLVYKINISSGAVSNGGGFATNLGLTSNVFTQGIGGIAVFGQPQSGGADVSVAMTAAPNPVTQGAHLTYTITVTNNGPLAANAVTMTDTLPTGATFVSATPTAGTCSGTTTVTCTLGTMNSTATVTLTLVVTATTSGALANTATVTSTTPDPNALNNSFTTTTTVSGGAAAVLSITKSHTGNFTQGQTGATYTVTVSNSASGGPTSGTVTMAENPPSGLTVTNMTGTGWTCTTASCTRSDALAAGTSYPAITVTVSVSTTATSPQVNSVTVLGGGSASATATDSTTINTASGGITFPSTTLPAGAVTVPYGADIPVTGGTPPYSFAVTSGTLPTGFTLDPTATTGSNAIAGHVSNIAPTTTGTFTFGVTVTDSSSPTQLTGNATISLTIAAMPANTQPGLLKGKYAMLLRGFNEVTGLEEGVVGSLTFDGTGNITGGTVDINATGAGSVGILSNLATTGVYVIGADNRGVVSIQPAGQNPAIFALSVGNVLNGVATTADMASFTDNSGSGEIAAGSLRLQDPTSFNNAAFAGTYVYDNTGQDPRGNRAAEIGLTTLNAANAVTSGSADTNLNGFVGSVRSITGSYTTPDSNGRSLLTLTLNTTPSSVVVYQISANEVVHMTLDARATDALLLGTAERQLNPATFSNTSLTGPDVFSTVGSEGTQGTSANVGLLTVTPGTTPTVNLMLDTNDNGTVTIGRALTGALSIAASGRGTMSPGGNTLIFYLTQPNQGFIMATDSPVEFGRIVPQVGAPFSASPFSSNVFFGMQEAVAGGNSSSSGVAALAPGAFNVTEDQSHLGGNLFFDASIGTLNFTVASNGHFTSNAGSNIGQQTGYMISPFEVVLFDTTHSASNPTPPSRPNVAIAQSIPGQVASPVVIAPTSLTFTSQTVGTTSAPQSVTVSNTGTAAINFAGFTVTGTNAGDFAVPLPTSGTMCNGAGSLAVGASCTINVLFTPTAVGTRTATLNVADNVTGSPQTVALTGTGAGPATGTVTVTPSSLTFASQPVNSTSPAQNVTVTNTGTGPVTFTSFSITGTNSSSFALANGTNACSPTGTLAASASCTIGVTLTPTATGELVATLSIADSATGSPQTVALNGTGNNSPVIISIPPGGSTTGTATPGGTAFFGLQITGAPGVTGTVQLGCTPSSPTITCAVIPSSVVLTGKPVEVAFGIQTFCQGATGTGFVPGGPGGGPAGGIGLLLFTLALGGAAWAMQRNRRLALTFAVLMLVALGTAACGGLAKGPNGATPPGTYTLTLTTTFNGQTQTLPNFLTLVVK